MLFDQVLQVLIDFMNEHIGIDELKGVKYSGNIHQGLQEAFGGKGVFEWNWMIPVGPKWTDPEEILQYRRKGIEVVVKDEWTVCGCVVC